MSGVNLPPDAPAVRLCHVIKWPEYEGYGFNLHTEKSKPGQYLGKIDPGSPAEAAALKEGDRIVEVNGVNVANENHKQVVERIKSVPNETKLLVVDPLADTWYREHKIIIKGSLPSVQQFKTEPRPAATKKKSAAGSKSSPDKQSVPAPRLCHITKRADFDGFGFNLHADKARNTQYVGAVDKNSPAEQAGLLPKDTIIEVNGANVEGLSHKEIVEKIKAVPQETKLLVVDEATAKWYKENDLAIHGDLPNVVRLGSKERKQVTPKAQAAGRARQPGLSEDTHAPRLCHLRKWPGFEGYGFNLHADKKRAGHFVGQVDPGGPAELGGLRRHDRLVEVNGANVENDNHQQIIDRIRQNRDSVDLLVVDRDADDYYGKKNVPVSGALAGVVHKYTPQEQPSDCDPTRHDGLSKSSTPRQSPSPRSTPPPPEHPPSVAAHRQRTPKPEAEDPAPSTPAVGSKDPRGSPPTVNGGTDGVGNGTAGTGGLDFTMKASELRELLKTRKKKDPREVQMDLRQKHKIIEQM